jgi:hypothetical protein
MRETHCVHLSERGPCRVLRPPFFVFRLRSFGGIDMMDIVYIVLGIGFFALAAAYVRGCAKL